MNLKIIRLQSFHLILLVAVIFSINLPVFSEETELPEWVRLEHGKRLFEKGDFSEALVIFKDLRESTDSYPEADYWIGRVFEEEGELNLAEAQYLKALETKKDLYISDDVLLIQNRLAYIYRVGREYHKYEEILKSSLIFSKPWNDPDANRRYPLMIRTLKEKGMDKLFELYRFDASPVLHVHSELGLYYYRTGRYEESLKHLVTAFVSMMTKVSIEIKYNDPLYEENTIEKLLSYGLQNERIGHYIDTVSFFPVAYYLGASLYALGEVKESRDFFTLVSDYSNSKRWTAEAMRQLTEPFIEPILTSNEYFYF